MPKGNGYANKEAGQITLTQLWYTNIALNINTVILFYLAHHKGAFNRAHTVYIAKLVEHEFLILLHVTGTNL